ncbi:MAG TPA: FAD-binding oxidoreductase [Vicinamibacterales bacterium]|nr:FAD-binding oxidoreductase [Vicinamibacterales bacterium]
MKEYPYWWDTVPGGRFNFELRTENSEPEPGTRNPEPGPPIPARADVVVVGAGYTGLSAARRLAMDGASVLVIDRETTGWGASSRNGGQVITGLKLDPATLVGRYGERRARELFDAARESIAHLESVIAAESIDCGYERTGHIQAAWKPSHFEAFRAEQTLLARVFDHHVDLLPRPEQRAEIGSDAYHGVMIDPKSAALNPAKYVTGLATAATRRGARIATGVAADRIERIGNGWRVVAGDRDIEARDVVLATDAYSDRAAGALRRRLVPIGSYIIATEPQAPALAAALLPNRRMAFDSKNFLFYFRVTDDHRVIFGGRAEFARPSTDTTRRAADILRRGMTRVFPQLESAAVEYAWSGNVAFSRDQMPHAGRLDGKYVAGGYSGHGIAMATWLGDTVGRLAGGERVEHPLATSTNDPFPLIPFYTGRPWFLPLVGAYYKVKDWLT